MSALHWFLILLLLPQLVTVWHIWRGEFPGRLEKRRLMQDVLSLPIIGMWQYWTSGVHRRRTNRYAA